MKVLISDDISQQGIEILNKAKEIIKKPYYRVAQVIEKELL